MGRRSWIAAVATAALLMGALAAPSASAAPEVAGSVTVQAVHLVTTGANSGAGSFRDAIVAANSDVTPVQIVFDPGLVVTLTTGAVTYTNTQPLELVGNGSTIDQATVDSPILSVFAAAPLIVNGLTFTNGDEPAGSGGAIASNGAVSITSSTFTANHADGNAGGAIVAGALTITSSVFTDNTAGGSGAVTSFGSLTITDSTFTNNTALLGTAGAGSSAGALTVSGSTFTDNTSGNAGGALVAGAGASITRSTFTGNTALGSGAVAAFGALTITESTFNDNSATIASGGAVTSLDPVTITRSSFSANTAAVAGGAIVANGLVSATNSTFSGNTANGTFGGGAIWAVGVSLVYATIADNTASTGANIVSNSTLSSFGSVISGPLGGGGNCAITGATTSTYSYATDGSCGFTGTGDTQSGADPQLGPLVVSSPASRAPAETSPLVDRIPVAACHATVTTDQRGVSRPERAGCDVGAVELAAALVARFAG